MYYLSRVEIDVANRQKIKDLSHVGAYHNWVESCFPSEVTKGQRSRKLWRIDVLNGKPYLLILSQSFPDKEKLERYGVLNTGESKKYDDFLSRIENGKAYTFRTVLNPTYSVFKPGEKRGKVFPEITVAQQISYLERQAEKNGFILVKDNYEITNRNFVVLKKAGSRPVKLSQVAFEGRLIVSDKEKFLAALTNGIGREKAYGCGLMTVIPAKE